MFETPFGRRLMVYCDYTASGRCLQFVETYIQTLQCMYANTHTEDDVTGRTMSHLLHEAETIIKASVNAGSKGCVVTCGTGATGAVEKLQQIIGVALAPATRQNLCEMIERAELPVDNSTFFRLVAKSRPVVFVGPYEHHSNQVTWRHSLAETVEVCLDSAGGIDLRHLYEILSDSRYQNRLRIGSFSAASNVTGVLTDVRAIASMLHAHNAIACFDYAASAPYQSIDMNPPADASTGDPSIDAAFFSPHKFLGGPGSAGVLVFNERIYHSNLPPTFSAGGTVEYVGLHDEDFSARIEDRERAGTPGIFQTLRAALALQIKEHVGIEVICSREKEFTRRAMNSWSKNARIEILGNPDPKNRIGIISFNVRQKTGKYLHHKFVATLLNDLFGIQSRAGCTCAGPYGHRLLMIDDETSALYRRAIRAGYCGLKPGWCRIGLHWIMDDAEVDYIIQAIHFVAQHGHWFLTLYEFDPHSGNWTHSRASDDRQSLSIDSALRGPHRPSNALPLSDRIELYRSTIDAANHWQRRLRKMPNTALDCLSGEFQELQYFSGAGRIK